MTGTWLPVRLDLVFEVRVSTCYHTVFFGYPVGSAVVLYQRLVNVGAVHCTVAVCGNLCGSAVGQAKVGCCLQVWYDMSAALDMDLAQRLPIFVEDSSLSGQTTL